MEISNQILSYLEIIFSWPLITLIIVIIFIIIFREPLSDFFRRLIKGEAYGVKFQASSPSEQREEAKDIPKVQPESELESYIRDNPQETIKTIIRLSRGYRFERIFNIIYGTQINLLLHLSSKDELGDKYINVMSYYNEYIGRSRLYSVKPEDYFGFLLSMQMIEFFGESTNFSMRITPEGIDFISYIGSEYPTTFKNKPF